MILRLLGPCAGLFLALTALTGCGGAAGRRITTDGVNFAPLEGITGDDNDMVCRSTARVCVLEPVAGGFIGGVNASRTNAFLKHFSSSSQTPLSPERCDLGVRFPNTWNDTAEVVDG